VKTYRAVSGRRGKIKPDKEVLAVETVKEPGHERLAAVHARGRIRRSIASGLEPFIEMGDLAVDHRADKPRRRTRGDHLVMGDDALRQLYGRGLAMQPVAV